MYIKSRRVCVCVCVSASPGPLHHLPHAVRSCLTEVWWRDPVVVACVTLSDCQAHLWEQVTIRHTRARSHTPITTFPSLSTSAICCGKWKYSKDWEMGRLQTFFVWWCACVLRCLCVFVPLCHWINSNWKSRWSRLVIESLFKRWKKVKEIFMTFYII